jgi:hypothetical protein
LSKVIGVKTDGNGKSTTEVTAFAYDKKGLNTLTATQDSNGKITEKIVSAYNKSGYATSDTWLDEKDKPYYQKIYTVKKGRTTAEADYYINDAKVDLEKYAKIDYKNGKKSKVTYASADGKQLQVWTYKKGVLSQDAMTDSDAGSQTVFMYDKYGNATSITEVSKNGDVAKTVLKNTYKNGKLVKVVWATAWSNFPNDTLSGLTVYTYKNGKLVKEVSAVTQSWDPGKTYGNTTTYAYTKGGLIKTKSSADSYTEGANTKITGSDTTAYQYQSVAVDKKCVKAVKADMEVFSYTYLLPGNALPDVWFWI